MTENRIFYFATVVLFLKLAFSCNFNNTSDLRDSNDFFNSEETLRIITSIDTIVQLTTEECNLDSAYKVFFRNYDSLCASSSLIPEIFDLFVRLQDETLFFEIWRLDWIMDLESGHREIWLRLNHSEGAFWKIFSDNASKFSDRIIESYNMMIDRDGWHGFLSISQDFDAIKNYGELERAYIAVLIITNTINSN